MYRVYDDRTNETLFESEDKSDCLRYLFDVDEESEEFDHVWIEEVKGDDHAN